MNEQGRSVRRVLVVGLLAGAALCGPALAAAPASKGPVLKAGVFDPPYPAPDFTLQSSDGRELKLSGFRGKLVVLAFGFTHCPEVCPVTLATLAQARKELGAGASEVQVVFVSVDPERDDPARMKTHLATFDTSFIGATGQPAALAAVYKNYGVTASKVPMPSGGYAVNHSSSIYLIDREGKLRAMMPYGHEPKDFVHDLKLLLAK